MFLFSTCKTAILLVAVLLQNVMSVFEAKEISIHAV